MGVCACALESGRVSITIYVSEYVKICVSGCEWVCTRVCVCESERVSIQNLYERVCEKMNQCVLLCGNMCE